MNPKCGMEELKIVMLCLVTVTSDSQKSSENFYMLLPHHVNQWDWPLLSYFQVVSTKYA